MFIRNFFLFERKVFFYFVKTMSGQRCNAVKCDKMARFTCDVHPVFQLFFCSKQCQFDHFLELVNADVGATNSGMVKFSPFQLNTDRVEQLLELLNDTTSEKKAIQATNLFSRWMNLPIRPRVLFFDAEEIKNSDVVIAVSAKNVSIDGISVSLEKPSLRLGRIRNAATDGRLIIVNRRIMTKKFQTESRKFIRFPVPNRVTHFAAIMVHEYGHIVHINKSTRGLLDSLFVNWVRIHNQKMPAPVEFTKFVEEVADRFAVSVFSLLR